MQPLDKLGMGDRIKQIRKKAGLRQWQLAEVLGTTQSAVHKYEHGVIPEPRRLIELSRIGNTTIEWILTGRHWENGSEQQDRPAAEVFRLSERLRAFSPEDQRALDEALRIMEGAVQALRASGALDFEAIDLAEKGKKVLSAAQRVQRAILDSILDLARDRLESSRPAPAPETSPEKRR